MSLRDDIFACDDKPKASVIVREWLNAKVFIKMLTAAERDGFDRETVRLRKNKLPLMVRERLVILCAEDEHGTAVFQKGDADKLAEKGNAGIDRLFRVACKHNGFVEDDADDDAAGN